MRYIFICNGREDKSHALDELDRQLAETGLVAEKYITTDIGDATRYVNIFCDLNPKEEVCFVACGGAGLTNEVMNGLVGRDNKYLGILFLDGTNDFVKVYPDRSFKSLPALLEGEMVQVDVIKLNDNYALNCASLGMDAMVCELAQRYAYNGDKDPYNKGVMNAFLFHRFNKMSISVDGKSLKLKYIQNGQVSNGKYTGGEFLCAPQALVDDGYLDVNIFKAMPAITFLKILKYFRKGEHIGNEFCQKYMVNMRARHIEIRSKDLIVVGIDGEPMATNSLDVDVVEKGLKLILPRK